MQVQTERGRPVGHALFSDESEITLRMIAFGPAAPPGDFVERRLAAAIAYRESLALDATAYRLVHGEADRLPSLIVDRYGDYLVVQALSQGTDRRLPEITAALVKLLMRRTTSGSTGGRRRRRAQPVQCSWVAWRGAAARSAARRRVSVGAAAQLQHERLAARVRSRRRASGPPPTVWISHSTPGARRAHRVVRAREDEAVGPRREPGEDPAEVGAGRELHDHGDRVVHDPHEVGAPGWPGRPSTGARRGSRRR